MQLQKTWPMQVVESGSAENSSSENTIRLEHSTTGADRNDRHRFEILLDGCRNDGLTRYAGGMRRNGASRAAIEACLLHMNGWRCKPPLPDDDVREIAKSVARYDPEPDYLEVAWNAVCDKPYPSNYRKFIALAQQLQYLRKEFAVALPL